MSRPDDGIAAGDELSKCNRVIDIEPSVARGSKVPKSGCSTISPIRISEQKLLFCNMRARIKIKDDGFLKQQSKYVFSD